MSWKSFCGLKIDYSVYSESFSALKSNSKSFECIRNHFKHPKLITKVISVFIVFFPSPLCPFTGSVRKGGSGFQNKDFEEVN